MPAILLPRPDPEAGTVPASGAADPKLEARRFGKFGGVGAIVLVLGTAFQWALIALGSGKTASYLGQAVFSIELSFVLNRWLTWSDRRIDLISALSKWNAQKLALTVPNVVVYSWLIRLGWNWLAANMALTAVFTVINYVGGNVWSFRSIRLARHRADGKRVAVDRAGVPDIAIPPLPVGTLPEVSVVIPVKNSHRTIRATIDSLLAQNYPAMSEIIIVGDVGDLTWQALSGETDPRVVIVEHEEIPGQREPAIKRDTGLRKARGELLALVDSDIMMDPDWLSRAVALLVGQRGGVVCGGMRSADDTFWGRFVDGNAIAAKTPRVPHSYKVTARNFGKHGRKPPITANAVMTREVYDSCPMDSSWAFGYEDYEWFWRIARSGHQILYVAGLTGAHHHRRSFRALCREYKISAHGCAEFIRAYPDSPLSMKRRRQALLLPLTASAATVCAAAVAAIGYTMPVAGLLVLGAAFLTAREVVRSRRLEALAYPVAGLALATLFTAGLSWKLAFGDRPASDIQLAYAGISPLLEDVPELPADADIASSVEEDFRLWTQEAEAPPELAPVSAPELDDAVSPGRGEEPGEPVAPASPEPASRRLIWIAVFAGILAIAAALRLWQLATKPDWQFDEAIYWNIARNLQLHGTLNEKITFGAPWEPFLYQPPLYLIALARWFAVTGSSSIYHARLLGVGCSLGSLTLLWRLAWRLNGPRAATFMIIPVAFDGWLLFVQRVSYIENVTLLLVIAGMLLYQRALDSPSWHRFALAGLVVGLAVCVKYTGLYAIITVVLCWLTIRRDRNGHLILLGAAVSVLAAEQLALTLLFDIPGHDWFINQSSTQIGRVLGVGMSKGTLDSPLALVHLLFAQYKVFLPSFAIALAALVVAIMRLVSAYRRRDASPLRPQALLYAWAIAGVVVFGFSSLRYQQYFALVLVPLYCIWWTEVWHWKRGMTIKVLAATLAVVAGLSSFWLRVGSQSDNVFAQVQQYAATSIPANAVVLADESVGDLIRQPYCQEQAANPCLWHATYAITWTTYLQSTVKLGDPAFSFMMLGATREWSRTGFNGTITVWRLRQ
jgi:glycosyltransferase AglI